MEQVGGTMLLFCSEDVNVRSCDQFYVRLQKFCIDAGYMLSPYVALPLPADEIKGECGVWC